MYCPPISQIFFNNIMDNYDPTTQELEHHHNNLSASPYPNLPFSF